MRYETVRTALGPRRTRSPSATLLPAGSPAWQRAASLASLLSWLTLAWLGIEAGVAVGAALAARSPALLGFGLDSGVEALASVIVVWRLSGSRRSSEVAERRGQRMVAVSFLLLGPYIAIDSLVDLTSKSRPDTSVIGIAITAVTLLLEPYLGLAKRRLGRALGSATVSGEGAQNLLCAGQAGAVLVGLIVNTACGWWWVDPAVGLAIATWALHAGWRGWHGHQVTCTCGCAPSPTAQGEGTAGAVIRHLP